MVWGGHSRRKEANGQVPCNQGAADCRTANAFEQQRTGHGPKAVSVILSGETLVITRGGTLSPADAARMQEYHRQLFANSSDGLRQEINRITGAGVLEAKADIETSAGALRSILGMGRKSSSSPSPLSRCCASWQASSEGGLSGRCNGKPSAVRSSSHASPEVRPSGRR